MSDTPMVLRINREGSFTTTPAQDTESQCGMQGASFYRYFVTIEATNEKLTSEGFVMENLWVLDYFHNRYERDGEPCRSCEDMAQSAVEHFVGLFRTNDELRGVNLRRVYVRIHGSEASFIEAEWKADASV